jgi:hypothetical protein
VAWVVKHQVKTGEPSRPSGNTTPYNPPSAVRTTCAEIAYGCRVTPRSLVGAPWCDGRSALFQTACGCKVHASQSRPVPIGGSRPQREMMRNYNMGIKATLLSLLCDATQLLDRKLVRGSRPISSAPATSPSFVMSLGSLSACIESSPNSPVHMYLSMLLGTYVGDTLSSSQRSRILTVHLP